MSYEQFVKSKLSTVPPTGIADGFSLPGSMFMHQSALTAWALRRGRAAIFADTGLGKMRMELAWADAVRKHTGRPVMIHTPLAVAAQLAAEAAKIGVDAKVCREAADLTDGINITNYDRRHKFDSSIFGGVVLDESGCIKHHDTRTFQDLTAAYRDTPFKLPATATPAPNDWTELGTHAEFLGICTRAEMLAEFFTHDGGDTSVWRLKGHAREIFWRWVATWGAMIRKPSNLGFDDGAYNLPALHMHEHHVAYEQPLNGMLFAAEAQTLSERREARRASMDDRVAACAALVNSQPGEAWVVWCDLIAELRRVMKPGRNVSFHCMDMPSSKERDGVIGLKDFPGDLLRAFQRHGFIFHAKATIWKDPVTAMTRTKALGLLHKSIRERSEMTRMGIPDYLITVRCPGESEHVTHTADEFPVSLWQQIASPVWMDIDPSDTLQFRSAREHDDERHICPLQLEVIRRGIMLWTNPGDIVLSPFGGIGSEPYIAVEMGRKAVAVELKDSYYRQMVANVAAAKSKTADLFSEAA